MLINFPIGGSDFDTEPWAYNEEPQNDLELSSFNKLDPRDELKVKHLKEIRNITQNTDIKLLGAAWSSPRWMKSNNDWAGFNYLKEEYYELWATYHVRFLELMRKAGIEFWSISTGNEPTNGNLFSLIVPFLRLGWDPISQGKWLANNLGPMINASFPDIKILVCDDQVLFFPKWFNIMYSAVPESRKYVYGHAFHFYWKFLFGTKGIIDNYELYPDKFIFSTEASIGVLPWQSKRPILGDWERGQFYINDIISSLNGYVNAWIDWNMILNYEGGPQYQESYLDAVIIASKGENKLIVNEKKVNTN